MKTPFTKKDAIAAFRRVEKHSGHLIGPEKKHIEAYKQVRNKIVKQVVNDLNNSTYVHREFRHLDVEIDGKNRQLAIGTIPDRTAGWMVGKVIMDEYDDCIHDSAIAYRPGKRLANAITELPTKLKLFPNILTFDLKAAYPSTTDDLVLHGVARRPMDEIIVSFVFNMLNSPYRNWSGLPIGSSLSPALLNHALWPLDEMLGGIANRNLRYSDNFLLAFDDESYSSDMQSIAQERVLWTGYKSHKWREFDARREPVEFIGIVITPEGEIKPSGKAIDKRVGRVNFTRR